MKAIHWLSALATALVAMVAQLQGQQSETHDYYQVINFVKMPEAGRAEFLKLINDVGIKVAETRLREGGIVSWTVLRSVMPAGSEARADYLISTLYEGVPPEPLERSAYEALFKKAGVSMSSADYFATRDRASSLVATELWRPASRIGRLQKGYYLFINYMKADDGDAYVEFEQTVWKPMAEQLVKDGIMSGWMLAVRQVPGGADRPYGFYTADMFPTWAAAFKSWSAKDVFEKVHPGENFDEAYANMTTVRTLAVRELWVVVERVAK